MFNIGVSIDFMKALTAKKHLRRKLQDQSVFVATRRL